MLDIIDFVNFLEVNVSFIVCWEFIDNNDVDLGYIFSQLVIGCMVNGKWVVIFGNGYNNIDVDGYVSIIG